MNLSAIFALLLGLFHVPSTDVAAVTPKLQTAENAINVAAAVVATLPANVHTAAAVKILGDASTVVSTAIVVGHTVEAASTASGSPVSSGPFVAAGS